MKINTKILQSLNEAVNGKEIINCKLQNFIIYDGDFLDDKVSNFLQLSQVKTLNIDIREYLLKFHSQDKKYIKELNKVVLTSSNNNYSLQFEGSVKGCAYIADALYGNLDEIDYEDLVLTCEDFTSKANAKKIAKYLTEEFYK